MLERENEDGHRPRLAHRDARRREGARSAVRAVSGRRVVHPAARPWIGVGDHRTRAGPPLAAPVSARRPPLLPQVPAAVSGPRRAIRSRRFDLVISSSHCVAKSVIVGRRSTPATATRRCATRGPADAYFGPERMGRIGSAVARPVLAAGPGTAPRQAGNRYVTNSNMLRGGSADNNREASVVYPPVDTDFSNGPVGSSKRAVV